MSLKSAQLESLARRLAETREREKELARQMKKARKAYEQAVQLAPPQPRKPAIRAATEPHRRGEGFANGDRKKTISRMHHGVPDAPSPAPPAEEAAEETLASRVPDYPSIRRTPTLLTGAGTGRASGANALPRAPYATFGSVYGMESTIGDLRRSRREKRHPAFRAFFAVGMTALLAFILVRILV